MISESLQAIILSMNGAVSLTSGVIELLDKSKDAEAKAKANVLLLQIAETNKKLADKINELTEKEKEIDDLNSLINLKKSLVKNKDAYYEGENEAPKGDPYCLSCFEKDGLAIHLIHDPERRDILMKCPACYNSYLKDRCFSL